MKWLLIVLFFNFNAWGESNQLEIKSRLQSELRTTYLEKLENIWGKCGATSESCLEEREDYMRVTLPKKESCFPYTMCGFYNCMEEKYQCGSVGVDYFSKLAFPTCSAYVKNINENRFTEKGVEWIYTVMVCLQKGLIDECEVRGNCPADKESRAKTCNHITEFTLNYHPGCYINSGIGVCKLPLKDKQNIWKTVGPYLTAREKKEAYKVIFECFRPGNKT